jgi:small subunit ribosomal protein S6
LWSVRSGATLRKLHFLLRATPSTVPGPFSPREVNGLKAYELMLLIDPSLDEEALAAVVEKTVGVITSQSGVIDSTENWGKRRLAYEVDGLTDGDYTVVQFHAEPAAIAELDRVLHITDPVARFMIVRRDDLE